MLVKWGMEGKGSRGSGMRGETGTLFGHVLGRENGGWWQSADRRCWVGLEGSRELDGG